MVRGIGPWGIGNKSTTSGRESWWVQSQTVGQNVGELEPNRWGGEQMEQIKIQLLGIRGLKQQHQLSNGPCSWVVGWGWGIGTNQLGSGDNGEWGNQTGARGNGNHHKGAQGKLSNQGSSCNPKWAGAWGQVKVRNLGMGVQSKCVPTER